MSRPRSAITKFILSLPRDLPAKAVISQAKAKGMATTESNVSRVRRLPGKASLASKSPATKSAATKSAATKSTAAKSTAAKSTAAKSASKSKPSEKPVSVGPTQVSKSEFIRQQPATMSAASVVAKAKAAGISIDSPLVYKVRGRRKGAKKQARAAAPHAASATHAPTAQRSVATNGNAPQAASAISSVEDLLRAVAAELGLGRSIEILRGERARLRAMIGG